MSLISDLETHIVKGKNDLVFLLLHPVKLYSNGFKSTKLCIQSITQTSL